MLETLGLEPALLRSVDTVDTSEEDSLTIVFLSIIFLENLKHLLPTYCLVEQVQTQILKENMFVHFYFSFGIALEEAELP